MVRAELCQRLARIEGVGPASRDFAPGLAAIRGLASAYGLVPAARIAQALEQAVARDGRACPSALYLARLKDAIGCDAADEQASQAMLASVCVRFA
jgi:hypothetical protein